MTRDEEKNAVRQLCELLGYSIVIEYAKQLWDERLQALRAKTIHSEHDSTEERRPALGQ